MKTIPTAFLTSLCCSQAPVWEGFIDYGYWHSSVASFLVLGGKTPKCTDRKKKSCTCNLYTRLRNIYISGLKIHLNTYTINSVPFYYLWYGAIKDSIGLLTKHYHWEKSMNLRASAASELRKFSHFYILKRQFPSIIMLLHGIDILCLRNIYFQVSNYICIHYTINAVSFYY